MMSETKGLDVQEDTKSLFKGIPKSLQILFDLEYGKSFATEFLLGEEKLPLYGNPAAMAIKSELIKGQLGSMLRSKEHTFNLATETKITHPRALLNAWSYINVGKLWMDGFTLDESISLWEWLDYFLVEADTTSEFRHLTTAIIPSQVRELGISNLSHEQGAKVRNICDKMMIYFLRPPHNSPYISQNLYNFATSHPSKIGSSYVMLRVVIFPATDRISFIKRAAITNDEILGSELLSMGYLKGARRMFVKDERAYRVGWHQNTNTFILENY